MQPGSAIKEEVPVHPALNHGQGLHKQGWEPQCRGLVGTVGLAGAVEWAE